jgi:hypothetical protein
LQHCICRPCILGAFYAGFSSDFVLVGLVLLFVRLVRGACNA